MVTNVPTTPLSIKLGIREDSTLVVLRAPKSFVLEISPSVLLSRRLRGRADVIVAFFTKASELEEQLDTLGQSIAPSGGLWIAWPKKSSGVSTDLTDEVVRGLALPLGLVDNKVCAVDETWTALRFVWRRTMRRTVDRRGVEPEPLDRPDDLQ